MYPELHGYVVDAQALMTYIFEHHRHSENVGEGDPYVMSLPLDRWLRDNARKEKRRG